MKTIKDKIAYHSRRLFDEHGYHGAALREVCKLAGCKMPTVYYHYKNKENLFDEAVRAAFEELVARLWAQLPKEVSGKEYYIAMVKQKKHLSEDERIIYRLALKTWLGFESCGGSRQKLREWEELAYRKTLENCAGIAGSVQWAKFIARSVTGIIQRIILMDDDIPDSEIEEEISMIFDVATHSNIKKPIGKD
ncbi:MAG: TetR/AcrR family transcriptional regulator [Oscillospiraceae bacterium]|jgi:AcrR family transcriptional regulator|nr:TetR/AcrR family transcriptional regulator [Oscillospiraceae bacterium]